MDFSFLLPSDTVEMPNKILPQAWPASGLFNSEFPVQSTEYSLSVIPIFYPAPELSAFIGYSSVCYSMIGIGHVPLVRTTKFISLQKTISKSPPQPFHFMFIQKWKFYTSLNPSLIQENTSPALIFGWIMDPKFSLQLGHLSQ